MNRYKKFTETVKYKSFTGKTEVNAALSFRSIKDLDKQYSAFFNKMTLGFECEVSAGNSIETEEPVEIDEEIERNIFESDFSWSRNDYIASLAVLYKPSKILEMFDITPIYGLPSIGTAIDIEQTIEKIIQEGYRVVALSMMDGNPIMEEPNLYEYRGFSKNNLEKFVNEETRLINVDLAINKAKKALLAIKNLDEKYLVVSSGSFLSDKIDSAAIIITAALKLLESKEARVDEKVARKAIYLIGEKINKYCKGWQELIPIMKGGRRSQFCVYNAEKELYVLNILRYDESGIKSPLLSWSKEGEEYFEEDYEAELSNKKEEAWQEHLAERQSGRNDENEDAKNEKVVEAIANHVAYHVDPNVKESSSYHGVQEFKGKYTVVESDSSITPIGAEIVSPVFTGVKDAMVWLEKIFDMIDDTDMETNKSTGLHVNIGTFRAIYQDKFYNNEDVNLQRPAIDVLKLAVLSGDHHLLDQFGRFDNKFARSLASNIRDLAASGFNLKIAHKSNLFGVLQTLNKQFVQNQSDRYRTVNMQHLNDQGYLEFRIAGGTDYHADKMKVRKAIYRYMQLCAIACDKEAYFKEYMKELYRRFVDSEGPLKENTIIKQPKPKNAQEALYVLRQWSSDEYTKGREGLDREALKHVQNAITTGREDNVADVENHIVLDLISGLNSQYYSQVTNNVLYSIRLLMLYTARKQPNPKKFLSDTYDNHLKSIKDYIAPKLAKDKPGWVKYFYKGTGLFEREIIASDKYKKFIGTVLCVK